MHKFAKIIFIITMIVTLFKTSQAIGLEWSELKGDHFIIYFTGDEKFAKDVERRAEEYYKQIAGELGYQRHSDFWTWDKRVKIYIYPDHTSFVKATGQPDWSQGMANYTDKELVGFAWSKGFIEGFLPHEMAHLIFRDYVGFEGEVPLWLDEGVAQWMELKKREKFKTALLQLAAKNLLMPIEQIMRLDIRNVDNELLVHTFYIEAVSLVGFLMNVHGSNKFIDFCRQLRDGKSLDDALKSAYSPSMQNIKEFEEQWREYIKEVK